MEFENIIRCYEGEKLQMDLAASNTKVPIAVPDINEEHKAEILKSSSLYVCTSLDEGGWTIAAVEAMSAGVPVLVSESQKDVVNDGKNGVLLASADPKVIAREVVTMLSDKSNWEIYSSNAKQFSKQFTWENTANATLCVLEEAVHRQASDKQVVR